MHFKKQSIIRFSRPNSNSLGSILQQLLDPNKTLLHTSPPLLVAESLLRPSAEICKYKPL